MNTKEIIKMNAIAILDISHIDNELYGGEDWALLHLNKQNQIKGLHYKATDDEEFDFKAYIPEHDVAECDVIYHGYVEEYIFYANEIKFKGKEYDL